MVFSTLHTNDAVSTPIRLVDMGAPRYMVAMSLQVVLAQRLLRMVCESCGEVTQLSPQEHEWMRHALGSKAADPQYRKGRGCTQCNGTGYLGRSGIYEMLEMTRSVVEAANQSDPAVFMQMARKQMEGHTLKDHAVELVVQGKTTVDEAMRASAQIGRLMAYFSYRGRNLPGNRCRECSKVPTAVPSPPSCSVQESLPLILDRPASPLAKALQVCWRG
jgi:MSHA biogenesis protein MshE